MFLGNVFLNVLWHSVCTFLWRILVLQLYILDYTVLPRISRNLEYCKVQVTHVDNDLSLLANQQKMVNYCYMANGVNLLTVMGQTK